MCIGVPFFGGESFEDTRARSGAIASRLDQEWKFVGPDGGRGMLSLVDDGDVPVAGTH